MSWRAPVEHGTGLHGGPAKKFPPVITIRPVPLTARQYNQYGRISIKFLGFLIAEIECDKVQLERNN